MGSSPWGHKESDTIGVTEHAGTLRPPCASPQKTPSCPFPANPPPPREMAVSPSITQMSFACSPPSHKQNRAVRSLLRLCFHLLSLTILSIEKLLLRASPWWLSGEESAC